MQAMQAIQTDYPRHGAVISEDELYRFVLTRWFDDELLLDGSRERQNADRHLPFLMHNSSTADGLRDDHTILKCCGFARRLGYGGIVVGNLYGYRARHPNMLFNVSDPVGPDNDLWLARIFARLPTGGPVIAAWGSLRAPGKASRIRTVVRMAEDAGVVLRALKISGNGDPSHPLMLPYDLTPVSWSLRLASVPEPEIAPSLQSGANTVVSGFEGWGDRPPRYNGSGTPCDMWTGPCQCGATHVDGV